MESYFLEPLASANGGTFLYDLSMIDKKVEFIDHFKTQATNPGAVLFPYSREYQFLSRPVEDGKIEFFYEKFPLELAENEIWYVAVTGFTGTEDTSLEVIYDNIPLFEPIFRLLYPGGECLICDNTVTGTYYTPPIINELFRTKFLRASDRVKYEYALIPQGRNYEIKVEGVKPLYMNALTEDNKERLRNNTLPKNTITVEIVLDKPNEEFRVYIVEI